MTYTLEDLNRDQSLYFGGGAMEARPGHYCKGGSNAAVNYQKDSDADLKARIAAATNRINEIFDDANRESQYQQQRDAVYKLNTDEVNRQAADAERANRFGLARSGLIGGSVDADATNDLNYRTNKGLLTAAGLADDSAAQLKTQDEQTRQNLLSLANSGLDASAAATMATNQLKANLDSSASDKATAGIGQLFGDMSQAYLANSYAKALQSGINRNNMLYGQNGYGSSGSTRNSYGGSTS